MSTLESTYASPIGWVAEQLARLPAAPVRRAVVLVAAERHAHAIRRLLCVDRAHPEHLAGVWFVRPVEFAQEILVRAGRAHMPGWEAVRRLRILHLFDTAALAGTLRYFNIDQLRSGQGYVDAFARTIADLEAGGLDAALALRVAEDLARSDPLAGDRLHDVAVAWERADSAAGARATHPQLLARACAVVAGSPKLLAPFGPIFAMLTASPSTMLLRFLRALPGCRAVLQDARPLRAGTQRWRELIRVHPPQGSTLDSTPERPSSLPEIGLVHRFLFETPENLTAPERPRSRGADGSVDIEEYPGIEDELEAAAVWVTEQVAAGVPLERIALVVPETEPYAEQLRDRLARLAGDPGDPAIRTYVAGGTALAASPAGRRLRGVLNAVARGLEAEATIRVLPWLRRFNQGSQGSERLSPSRAADIVYGSGIIGGSPGDSGGMREWIPRLERRQAAMRQLAVEPVAAAQTGTLATEEPEKRLAARARNDAARWLRDVEPILPAITALQQVAETVMAGASLDVAWQQFRAFCEGYLRIPPDPPNILGRLDTCLQPILTDAVARSVRGSATLRVLIDALRSEPRQTARFGEACVFIGTGSQAAGLPFAAVRILGLAEGALPHTPHDDPIVPDTLRKRIEDAARRQQAEPDIVLPRLGDHVLDDIHDVFRVVSGTADRLALSAPRQWVDRSEREVSGILLEVATALGRGVDRPPEEGDVPTAARLRAAYLGPGRAARRQYAAAHPLSPRALLAMVPARAAGAASIAVPAGWTQPDALAIDRLWQRTIAEHGDALSTEDGLVSDAWRAAQPPGLTPKRPISQSALTMLLSCPYRFLQERVLYLSEPASRPSTDVIAPVDYGALFHAAAERFFREAGPALCRREGRFEEWAARARAIAGEEFDALRQQYPMRGEDGVARERNRLLRQIEQLVRYEWLLPAREFLDSELSFGDPEPVRLALDGGDLFVWGAIDRVDRIDANNLAVRDLKTGRVRDFGEDPMNAGRDLQIGLYVLALETSGYGQAPVGLAAYVHPSAAQEPDRAFAGAELERLRRSTREWLDIARQLLSLGAFPRTPNPEDCTYCPFVPACGEGAQQRSAAKLNRLPPQHPLEAFARFKRKRSEDAA